jgi:2-polyprenyl-3-methyl-5-hydroxy-6-metoxy-1,4-benzoquinol methylase
MRLVDHPSRIRALDLASSPAASEELPAGEGMPLRPVSSAACPACRQELSRGCGLWHRRCRDCGYESADLVPRINAPDQQVLLWEKAGLRELRTKNFLTLLRKIDLVVPAGGRLLDVGCAHGWFLDLASQRFQVLGIEPDRAVFEAVRQRGLPVRWGFFPEALAACEEFDAIVFNDAFEHIPDVRRILDVCRQHLRPGGALVLNLPSSGGVLYRVAKLLRLFGVKGFFERLWQKDLPSPHLHYFNHDNLSLLLEGSSFRIRECGRLETLHVSGLYERVSHTGSYRRPQRLLLTAGLLCLIPVMRLLPGDIMYVLAIKQ